MEVRDCRGYIQADNQAIIHTWHGRGSRSKDLNRVAQRIFSLVTERNIALSMHYVPSEINAADCFSRRLSRQESMLSPRCWRIVQAEFGGERGHTLDLMALDSNVTRDRLGRPRKHFTPYPTPGSAGVNVFNHDLRECDGVMVNAYVFPPSALIFPLLRFFSLRMLWLRLQRLERKIIEVRLLQARISPSQAEPFFLTDLVAVTEHICSRLKEPGLTQKQIFILARDQAFLKVLFFCWRQSCRFGQSENQGNLVFSTEGRHFV